MCANSTLGTMYSNIELQTVPVQQIDVQIWKKGLMNNTKSM